MNRDYLQHAVTGFIAHWQNLVYALVIVLATAFITLIVHLFLRKHYRRESTHVQVWRDAVVGSLNAPLQGVLWMIGLSISVGALTTGGHLPLLAEVFPRARDVAAIAIVAWYLIRFVNRAENNLCTRADRQGKNYDATATDAISKLIRAIIVIVALLVMMQSLGYSIASLLAFGGVAGIAVGFAARSLVANLLGGATIYLSHIFKVGDDIILPGTEVSGTVQHIGWRSTRVLGWIGKPFYVPNAIFNTSTVINHSRLERRSFSENILLRYRDVDKIPAIVRAGNEMLGKRDDLSYFVFRFDGFGDAALKLNLYAWPQTSPQTEFLPYAEFARIKEELLLAIAAIARDAGCELIQPVSYVYLRGNGQPALPEPTTSDEQGPPENR